MIRVSQLIVWAIIIFALKPFISSLAQQYFKTPVAFVKSLQVGKRSIYTLDDLSIDW